MHSHLWFGVLVLLTVAGATGVPAQQRIEFQRQKFDRDRFARPDPAARPPPPGDAAATVAPAATVPGGAEPVGPEPAPGDPAPFADVPAKWFTSPKDYDDLVELQKTNGACLVIYFKNTTVPYEQGFCSMFENKVLSDSLWRKALKYYLKLEISLPGSTSARELATKFHIKGTPMFLVVPPTGAPMPLDLIVFPPQSAPVPVAADKLLKDLKVNSPPAYQNLF